MQKTRLVVIMHVIYKKEIYETLGVLEQISEKLVQLVNTYDVEVALENMQVLIGAHTGNMELCVNTKFEVVEIANHINENYEIINKVGTVLDICHMVSTVRIFDYLDPKQKLDIKDYFEEFGPTLKVIHLANSVGLGLEVVKHGVTFEEEHEIELLRYILKLIGEYSGYVTLEVQEEDYNNTHNWVYTKNLVEELLEWD